MSIDIAVRRAQVYRFLADAFLYPTDDWTQDLPACLDILRELGLGFWDFGILDFASGILNLQAEHRRCFGLVGSLCYETEMGLPHEFRQSQEMADIAGFYHAFGFKMGGPVRERPDHIAAELEFMQLLALKEACAFQFDAPENAEVCVAAQRKFLAEHLGRWVNLFAAGVASSAVEGPYPALARLAAAFVQADAERLGVTLEPLSLAKVKPTPLGPEITCGDCLAATGVTL